MTESIEDELIDGLLKSYRKLVNRQGVLKEEIRISDALANNAGKVNAILRTKMTASEYVKSGKTKT